MKKEKLSKKTKKVLLIILAITVVLSFIWVLSGVDKPHLKIMDREIKADNVLFFCKSDSGNVMLDKQGKRMIITDKNGKVINVVETTTSTSPVDVITSVAIYDGKIYVVGNSYYNKGNSISSEAVLKYDIKGKFEKEIYSKKYNKDDYVFKNKIKGISFGKDKLYLTESEGSEVSVISMNLNGKEENEDGKWNTPEYVFYAMYNPTNNNVVTTGRSKTCYIINCKDGSLKEATVKDCYRYSLEAINVNPDNFNFLGKGGQLSKLEYCYEVGKDGDVKSISVVSQNSDKVFIINKNSEQATTIDSLKVSGLLYAKTVLYWIAVFWLVLCALAFLIWLIIKKLDTKGRIILLVIGGLLFVAVFYSVTSAHNVRESYKAEISTQAKQQKVILDENFGDLISDVTYENLEEKLSDEDFRAGLSHYQEVIAELSKAYGAESSVSSNIMLYGENNEFISLIDSKNSMPAGMVVDIKGKLKEQSGEFKEYGTFELENQYDTEIISYANITNSKGETVGCVITSCRQDNISTILFDKSCSAFLKLLTIFILFYVCYYAFRSFGGDIRRFKSRDKSQKVEKAVDFSGIFIFAYTIITNMDSVILVYVIDGMCSGLSPAKKAVMLALPMAAASAGGWIGTLVSNLAKRKIGERTLAIMSALVGIGTMLLIVTAVIQSNIVLFSACKFIYGMLFWGIFLDLGYSIPYNTDDEATRRAALNSAQRGNIAAAILSLLLGGYISEYLPNEMIYLISAALIVPLLFMSMIVFSNKNRLRKKDRKDTVVGSTSKKISWGLYLKWPTLAFIIFYTLPYVYASGYSGYIFPLYASAAGVSAVMLSNITVFSKALGLICSGSIERITNRFSSTKIITASMLIFSLCLVLFIISPNIYWAVTVMFITYLLSMVRNVPVRTHTADLAQEFGYNPKEAQTNYNTIRSTISVSQSPVLSFFMGIGYNLGTMLLGVITGVMFGIFGLISKHRNR